MGDMSDTNGEGRCCFVTVGATASFIALVQAVLEETFLKRLASLGYSRLRLQYGKDGESTVTTSLAINSISSEHLGTFHGVDITGFEFRKDGLAEEMAQAKGLADGEGVVVSHAGSGSILDAMRINIPLIVVPNSSLLHNHQEELAEELAQQGYVVHGKLGNLPAALDEVETLRRHKKAWPPKQPGVDPSGRGLMGILDDEMGFVD